MTTEDREARIPLHPEVDESSVALEAARIVRGARRSTYGPVTDSFEGIARYWSAYLTQKHKLAVSCRIEATDVAALMALLKLSREAGGQRHERDSLVDICGYADLWDQLIEAQDDPDAPSNFAQGGLIK